jgi:hypothetical protein
MKRVLLGRDGHDLRHTVHGLPRRIEDAVVGPDEQPTVPRADREIAIAADARIDLGERIASSRINGKGSASRSAPSRTSSGGMPCDRSMTALPGAIRSMTA